MQPIVTHREAWSVCWSVCHDREPCKKGWTDPDAIWGVNSGRVAPRKQVLGVGACWCHKVIGEHDWTVPARRWCGLTLMSMDRRTSPFSYVNDSWHLFGLYIFLQTRAYPRGYKWTSTPKTESATNLMHCWITLLLNCSSVLGSQILCHSLRMKGLAKNQF